MQNKIMNLLFSLPLFFLANNQPTTKQGQEKEMQLLTEMMRPSRSVMLIDPKQRAEDYQKAFDLLRTEKSTSKVFFDLAGGEKISNVIEMKMMPNSTLVLFRFNTPEGIRFQIVEIENILGIYHQ